jgi:hypothetical protein
MEKKVTKYVNNKNNRNNNQTQGTQNYIEHKIIFYEIYKKYFLSNAAF